MAESSWLNRIWTPTGRQLPSVWKLLHTLEGTQEQFSVAWSPDGRVLATDSFDGVQLWDSSTGTLLRSLIRDHRAGRSIGSVAWSPDGKLLASEGNDRKVQLWDPVTGALLRTLECESPGCFRECFAWSPDGKLLAYSTNGSEVPVWDSATGTLLRVLKAPRADIYDHYHHVGLAWSSDGRLMTFGTDDKVRLWNPTTGALLRSLIPIRDRDRKGSITSVAWSPDGRLLAIGSHGFFDGVQLWDPTTGGLLHTLKCKNGVYSIDWSPDGKLLAISSCYYSRVPFTGTTYNSRANIRIWRTDTREVLAVSPWLKVPFPIAWHPRLTLLVTSGPPQEPGLCIWHLDLAALLQAPPSSQRVPDTDAKAILVDINDVSKQIAPSPDRENVATILQRKSITQDFDVFLCHNRQDKPEVKQIGEQLKLYGVLPWLDEWELRPGLPWQQLLEEQIMQIKAAAVFVGKNGWGPWHRQELNAFLREFVRRGCPVIPVLLPDAPEEPPLPEFLKAMTWVDFRVQEPDPIQQLLWGITGRREGTKQIQGDGQERKF